jgi:hypothetical protein
MSFRHIQQQLPQELLDTIVDHLSHNKRALLSCAQAFRALLVRSRLHIYKKLDLCIICLDHSTGSIRSRKTAPQKEYPVSHPLPCALQVPDIACHVQKLRLPDRVLHWLPHIVDHLVNLKDLELVAIS